MKDTCPHLYEYEDWPKNIYMCWKEEEANNQMKECNYKHNYSECPIYQKHKLS